MPETYRVRLDKESLGFSAAHFLTLDGGQCERLHGHNYRVTAEVEGPLTENQYVVDFLVLEQAIRGIIEPLDHHVLLPAEHPSIRVAAGPHEVETHFGDRRWVFPRDDCVLLPLENTSAELLARFIAQRLLAELVQCKEVHPRRVQVAVGENFGQWGLCQLDGQ